MTIQWPTCVIDSEFTEDQYILTLDCGERLFICQQEGKWSLFGQPVLHSSITSQNVTDILSAIREAERCTPKT